MSKRMKQLKICNLIVKNHGYCTPIIGEYMDRVLAEGSPCTSCVICKMLHFDPPVPIGTLQTQALKVSLAELQLRNTTAHERAELLEELL